MGINTLTAARIYAVGEAGELTIDTLPESAFVKTYSNDAQVTDSAASMSAYMTGVKQNNGVISMSGDTMRDRARGGRRQPLYEWRTGADPAGAGESARPRHRHRHHHQRHRRHPGRDLCPRLPPQAAEPDRGDDGAGRRRLTTLPWAAVSTS
jgi:hypothetical protein